MSLHNDDHYTRVMTSNTSISSTEDDDWHSIPASSLSMTTAADEPDVDAGAGSGDDAYTGRKPQDTQDAQDAITPTATATFSAAIPHAAESIASSVGGGEQDQNEMTDAQRGARPGSDSVHALYAQGPGTSDVTSSGMADRASRVSMTSSARDRSPSPSFTAPAPALRQRQRQSYASPHTRVSSISSVHSASSTSHNPSAGASNIFQIPLASPGRLNGRRARPMSLASVMSGAAGGLQGPLSPPASVSSPRSSGYYNRQLHQQQTYNILNRPLPQTPAASVSGGSRPASLQFFSSPIAGRSASSKTSKRASSGAHWEPQMAAVLRNEQSVPRPLRLQPSPMLRDTFDVTTGTSAPAPPKLTPVQAAAATAASMRDEAILLRAHQAASRMSHRRQWQQHLSASEYEVQHGRLESNEGAFEVIGCFLQRLAQAENDALQTENFPRSAAQQQQQQKSMDLMRKETVEALLPLIAYGPGEPAPKKKAAAAKAAPKKMPAPAPPAKAYTPAGMPPTPPMSPYQHDPRRESGMSGITETSLNGGHDENGGSTTNTTTTKVWGSVKRASALFSWGAAGANAMPSPAQSTRFTSE